MKINEKISRAGNAYFSWKRSSDYSLYYCYKNPSDSKLSAESGIREKMISEGGERFRIISHSMHFFTCGYIFYDKIGGAIFHYFTPYYDVCIPLDAISFNMKPSQVLEEFSYLYN